MSVYLRVLCFIDGLFSMWYSCCHDGATCCHDVLHSDMSLARSSVGGIYYPIWCLKLRVQQYVSCFNLILPIKKPTYHSYLICYISLGSVSSGAKSKAVLLAGLHLALQNSLSMTNPVSQISKYPFVYVYNDSWLKTMRSIRCKNVLLQSNIKTSISITNHHFDCKIMQSG